MIGLLHDLGLAIREGWAFFRTSREHRRIRRRLRVMWKGCSQLGHQWEETFLFQWRCELCGCQVKSEMEPLSTFYRDPELGEQVHDRPSQWRIDHTRWRRELYEAGSDSLSHD